ncbi:hypothetical protein [Dinoroseobacter sp. S124A]|uniref:hypothetical protein n=1 Tax=Dinoroseobacter sp. S124A TaxID=3415128 RepID=UPI003C7D012B
MPSDGPQNIELIDWLTLKKWSEREKLPITDFPKTFRDAADAIDKRGPMEWCTDRVNVMFIRTAGRFEDSIVALRQSGLNVRRVLISEDTFVSLYGNFQGCLNHLLSNNAVGPEVEYAHIVDFADYLELSASSCDPDRNYTRTEIDSVATLQMFDIRDQIIGSDPEVADVLNFMFDVGFTAGRNFSAVQNIVTLEPSALAAQETRQKNIAKGRKSGSADRRFERLRVFMDEVEAVYDKNNDLREYEDMVLRVAFNNAIPPGEYGHGQFNHYCVALRSEQPFKARFDRLFRNSLE